MDIPGLIVPLATPFTDDSSSLSEVRFARMVEYHRERGALGFILGSEAGEYTSLSLSERKQLTEYLMRQAGDLPIYVNATCTTTAATMDLCQDAFDSGAAAALVTPPIPGGHTQEEIEYFLRALRRHGNICLGFLDPHLHYQINKDLYITPGTVVPLSYNERELEIFNCLGPSPMEFWSPRGVAHPVGIFGPEYGMRIIQRWDAFGKAIQAMLKIYGPHRIAKYFFEREGIDLGPPRPPYGRLAEKGQAAVNQLLSGLQ